MLPRRFAVLRLGPVAVALLAPLALAPAVSAHGHVEVGEYSLTIGWINEPTFVGQPNGIEVLIEHHDGGAPVTDLTGEALTVTVETAGQRTDALPLEPGFSLEGGFGTPGSYEAEITPTTPGEYRVVIAGTIHDTEVDVAMTSGEETFSSVRSSSEIEFPVQNPSMADVVTRLERIDDRIEELQQRAVTSEDVGALRAEVESARTMGLVVGGAGVVMAIAALYVAGRAGRRGTGTA